VRVQTPSTTDLIQDLRAGSPVALIESARMVTKLLVEYRAYDFADHWEEFIQEVLGQLIESPGSESGGLEIRLRRATLDELSHQLRATSDWNQDGELPWCESSRMSERATPDTEAVVAQFRLEIEKLPEQRAQVVNDVFGDGRNFDQVAAERKIPLRMVKRFLRESIWDLRERSSKHRIWSRDRGDERVKSCLKSLELDLPAFLVEPQLAEWREFRAHYPVCQDCSVVVANWSNVEAMVREACGGSHRHPSAEDLIALQRDGEGLAYSQYVSLMRHLDGCPPCSEAMTLLASFDRRPIAEQLINRNQRWARSSRMRSWLSRAQARVRAHLSS